MQHPHPQQVQLHILQHLGLKLYVKHLYIMIL